MSTLYLDFGNTRIKWKQGSGAAGLLGSLAYEQFEGWLPRQVEAHSVRDIVFASVLGDQRQRVLSELMTRLPVSVKRCVVTAEALGVRCAYQDLERLGIDRWLAVLAAWVQTGGACLVVDLGTAATLDLVDDGGRHQGGYIVCGLQLALTGLLAGTDNIRPDPAGFGEATLAPGVNTAQAVYHGALLGMVGLIETSYQKLLKSSPKAKLILAGGDAALVGSHLVCPHECVGELVFDGMQLLEKAELLIDA